MKMKALLILAAMFAASQAQAGAASATIVNATIYPGNGNLCVSAKRSRHRFPRMRDGLFGAGLRA